MSPPQTPQIGLKLLAPDTNLTITRIEFKDGDLACSGTRYPILSCNTRFPGFLWRWRGDIVGFPADVQDDDGVVAVSEIRLLDSGLYYCAEACHAQVDIDLSSNRFAYRIKDWLHVASCCYS